MKTTMRKMLSVLLLLGLMLRFRLQPLRSCRGKTRSVSFTVKTVIM